ncbi:MAG: DUF5054 domain-containing protein [Bryobacteraceae bacterium]|jgi:hypothetical protein
MRRRNFVGNLLAAGAFRAVTPGGATAYQSPESLVPDTAVKRVLVMFKCHLDVGFIDTQANVVRMYFERHFPKAIETAAAVRREGNDSYIWTTGSWLIYEYLEKAGRPQQRLMEQAILSGDIAWHALPFTWQTELLDPSLIAGALGFSQSLDRRFQRTTTGAKMSDVPGHTRAIIGPLVAHGVKLLDIGVNSASTPPDVPPAFQWKDPGGNALTMLYHPHSYGDVVKIPGSDLAIDVEVRDDNSGPHSIEEIRAIYSGLRKRFPNAQVTASNLTGIANAVEPYRERLPVITQEIGDTWIYGAASDPLKVARYREVARLRSEWIGSRKLQEGGDADRAFLSSFLLEVEHTWGTDTKTWLDFDHYTPHDLQSMLDRPKYKVVVSSWAEKRQDLLDAIATLPAPLRAQATARVRGLNPVEPATAGLLQHRAGDPIETRHFEIALDPQTGAITRLRSKKTGRDWASTRQPLALFSYQTLAKSDYDRFFAAYLKSKADWAPKDFGKPNIERFGARSRTWLPVLMECRQAGSENGHRILAQMKIDDAAAEKSGTVAWPQKLYLELTLPDAEPVVEIGFSWFGKAANRMPEALWLTFQPVASDPRGWLLDKAGSSISPFDVVTGGNRAMHAVLGGLRYKGPEGALAIETLDAPVVALGERLPVYFSRDQPDLAKGFHFNLFNNGWGTNYIQWFGEDMRFRFRIAE